MFAPIIPSREPTARDRIAMTECVRLMAVLAESGAPAAQALAVIIGVRLVGIADKGVVAADIWSAEDLAPWVGVARDLTGDMARDLEASQ